MTDFMDRLKSVVADVARPGGQPFVSSPPPDLAYRLKRYAANLIRSFPATVVEKTGESGLKILEDWPRARSIAWNILYDGLSSGSFDAGLARCLAYLNQGGETEPRRTERILRQVVKTWISVSLVEVISRRKLDVIDLDSNEFTLIPVAWPAHHDDPIVEYLARQVWSGGSGVQEAYEYAEKRQLIERDFRLDRWQCTPLGHTFLDLRPVEQLCFLLTIDVNLSRGWDDKYYINREILNEALARDGKSEVYYEPEFIRNLWKLELLGRMGLLSTDSQLEVDEETLYKAQFESSIWAALYVEDLRIVLTNYGRRVIERVLSDDNPWKQVVVDYFDSHLYDYGGFAAELSRLSEALEKGAIPADVRLRINRFVELLARRDYIAGLRLIFPEIERLFNQWLERLGERPDRFPGLREKIRCLESRGIIPADLARALEIIEGRNKVLHGQFAPPDPEYAYPLCLLALVYLRRVIEAWQRFSAASS